MRLRRRCKLLCISLKGHISPSIVVCHSRKTLAAKVREKTQGKGNRLCFDKEGKANYSSSAKQGYDWKDARADHLSHKGEEGSGYCIRKRRQSGGGEVEKEFRGERRDLSRNTNLGDIGTVKSLLFREREQKHCCNGGEGGKERRNTEYFAGDGRKMVQVKEPY